MMISIFKPKPQLETLPRSAILKEKPPKFTFTCMKHAWSDYKIEVIDHTNFFIDITYWGHLMVGGHYISHLPEKNSRLVAYCLEGHPQILCFERTFKKKGALPENFFLDVHNLSDKNRLELDTENKIHQISEAIYHRKKALPLILLGGTDEKSLLANIPLDIIHYIALHCLNINSVSFNQSF